MRYDGKITIVTGGSKGIGEGCVRVFAEAGSKVVFCARNEKEGNKLAEEITKKLDEFIIDPKVTVTLEKAMSVRYSVMGNVVSPGVRIMDRKVSLYEAVIEAGGIAKNGDKKKIALIRYDARGNLSRQEVNLTDIESGKAPMIFLNPGDQVFVPKKGFSLNWDTFGKVLGQASVVRLLFGSPF